MIFHVGNFIRNMHVFNVKNKILWKVIKRIDFKPKFYLKKKDANLFMQRVYLNSSGCLFNEHFISIISELSILRRDSSH